MIQHLFNILTKHLQNNLPEIKTITHNLKEIHPKTFPSILLYPAKFKLNQSLQHINTTQLTPEKVQILQEFQQQLLINIYDENIADIEKLASLTIAIMLTDWEKIMLEYNDSIPKYTTESKKFSTKHLIDSIQLIEATPNALDSYFQWQFKFKVNGHLQLSKEITPHTIIEKVNIPIKISAEKIYIEMT